jgi:hypothetical protein
MRAMSAVTAVVLRGDFTDADLALVRDLAARIGVLVTVIDTDEAALVLADALQLSVLMDSVPPVASTLEQRRAWVIAFKAMMDRQGDVIAAAFDAANARSRSH